MQDKVCKAFSEGKVKHYLTGGTALSRVYLKHRYSDDLDFFLNNDPDFENESDRALGLLYHVFDNIKIDNRQLGFMRLFITENEAALKIDLINDVAYHFNDFEITSIYYKTDNPLNIFTNKIAALSRQAAKDLADIIWLCKKVDFTWPDMIEHAARKDNWVNEVDVLAAIQTFDQKKLFSNVLWMTMPDPSAISRDIKRICFDIASAGRNSLFTSKP